MAMALREGNVDLERREGDFTCIRAFTSKQGWVARYTRDGIAEVFPLIGKAA